MMILKCLAAAFVLYLIVVFIVAVIGGIIQKVRKKQDIEEQPYRSETLLLLLQQILFREIVPYLCKNIPHQWQPVREGRERDGRLRRLFRDRIIKRTGRRAEL